LDVGGTSLLEGTILKAYGGFYYVRSGAGTWECSLRGRHRLGQQGVMVGDRVTLTETGEAKGVIERFLPRSTVLIRPPIANVDQAVIIFSFVDPRPNTGLLDRILIQAVHAGLTPLICFNKLDLREDRDVIWPDIYAQTGYPVISTSTVTDEGVGELKGQLKDRLSVLAGPSGTGKSSLLNVIQPGLNLKTGQISRKLKRGKHTTRHVELLHLDGGGMVADTPGFSNLGLPAMPRVELGNYYPEFDRHLDRCKFTGCMHHQEPVCGVKDALVRGEVSTQRYESYLTFLTEVIANERRY